MSLEMKKLFKDLWMILSITIISILVPSFEINAKAMFSVAGGHQPRQSKLRMKTCLYFKLQFVNQIAMTKISLG
jgi:hypothetical protein